MSEVSVRLLAAGDEDKLDAFLKPHTPCCYFLRSNARRGGLRYEGKPYQADFFGAFEKGEFVGVLAHAWIGAANIFAPDRQAIRALADAWKQKLAMGPREVRMFTGVAGQIADLLNVLGIEASVLRPSLGIEGLYTLDLDKLSERTILKSDTVVVRLAETKDAQQLIPWRHDFYIEALGDTPGQETYDRADSEIKRRIQEGDLFVLEENGELMSFCGAGGFLPDWKIVGPVWTPPEKRGCGYGRTVTAGALEWLRRKGASKAVLFSQNPQAIRGYEALGFRCIGDWRLDFLIHPVSRL